MRRRLLLLLALPPWSLIGVWFAAGCAGPTVDLSGDASGPVIVEFGGCNIDSRTYFQDFFYTLHPNYRLHRILRNGIVPIEHYRGTQEIFVTTNFVAVSREL